MSAVEGLPLIKAFKLEVFPIDRLDPGGDLLEFLAKILVTDYVEEFSGSGVDARFEMGLTVAEELVLNVVGLEGFGVVFGGATSPSLRFGMASTPVGWEAKLGAGARLRFPRNILKPVRRENDQWVDDALRPFAEIGISTAIIIDHDWNVTFEGTNSFHLDAAMIADSGLVVEGDIALDLSETSGLRRGVIFKSVSVYLPDAVTAAVPIESLKFENFHIGTGGVTGTISLATTPPDGTIGGFPFRPTALEVELKQNCLIRAQIEGLLTLSLFDEPLAVTAGFDLDGNFTVAVKADSGMMTLQKEGVLSMTVAGLGFAVQDGVFTVAISGTLTPLFGGDELDWPGFEVQELSIDSEGHVRLEGGWLNLPSQYSLDFFGFQVSITRLGMGQNDDGSRWIGFSGGIKFVDGLSIGGTVDGLCVTWYDGEPERTKITMDGVGVELEIPEVMRFKGSVSYHEIDGMKRFDGAITLDLMAMGLRIDGKIVIGVGTNPAGEVYTFFALYIAVQLPAGIPLWSTGLGLFGMAGLVAIQMAPNKGAAPNDLHPQSRANEEWFENEDGSPGWYKRPEIGVTDLKTKWDPMPGAFALGGGVTIGTVVDNGFTFAGSFLLAITFPGPVIMLEGKANLLKERSSLTDDPLFRALVVLDFRSGTFLVGLMAQYKIGDGGELIDIAGSAEAFFDFNDPMRWHLYLGVKDPKVRRIRAQILTIFEANSYFMLDASRLQMGGWVGYDKEWNFGPLNVVLQAWIEGGAVMSFKPVHFHGELWLHGTAELRVFGFGAGATVDARFAADVFDPFHLIGEFSTGIDLPWPMKDFDVDITLEWGPTSSEPPLPLPLKEVAIEHFKATASWPLPRQQSLLSPNTDDGNGFLLRNPVPTPNLTAGPPTLAPVVPLDSRPHITFGRAVNDDALIGVNPQPVWPNASPPEWERIGNPATNQGPMRVRFGLKEVSIAQWNGSSWIDVARKGTTDNQCGVRELFGSWAPIPQLPSGIVAAGTDLPVAQVKLWLWSRTPFDYSRHSGRAWDEWFTDRFNGYPCIPPAPDRTFCCSFDDMPVGSTVVFPMPCREHPELVFLGNVRNTIGRLPRPSHGHTQAFCWQPGKSRVPIGSVFSDDDAFLIMLNGEPARLMTLVFAGESHETVRSCFDVKDIKKQSIDFPFTHHDTTVRIFDKAGKEIPAAQLVSVGGERGFNMGHGAEVTLPCAASSVDLVVWQQAAPIVATGYDHQHKPVDRQQGPVAQGRGVIRLSGSGIKFVVIEAPGNEAHLIEVCADCLKTGLPDVQVLAIDSQGTRSGPYKPVGDTLTVEVKDLRAVVIDTRDPVCLVQVCVTIPPSASEIAERQEMAQHLTDAMALWGGEGELLSPNASYRLKIVTSVEAVGEGELAHPSHTYSHEVTEVGYFKTEGPPGLTTLSTPLHHPPGEAFSSGLDDLIRYVRQTVPPTVPARGEQPLLPRPVYRAYDVGVEFNENYVDLMYRLARRDLTVYLFDINNQPVRDVDGRVIVFANRWGVTDSVNLSEGQTRYLSVIDRATCVAATPVIIPHEQTLFVVDSSLVMEPDTVHEARLVPLLMHEDFRDGRDAWTVVDVGANGGESDWATVGHPTLDGPDSTAAGAALTLTCAGDLSRLDPAIDVVTLATDVARPSKTYRIVAFDNAAKTLTLDGIPQLVNEKSPWRISGWGAITQKSNISGGDDTPSTAPKPGTLLVRNGSSAWTDYRFSVQIRSSDDDALGIVFRYHGPQDYYRFSMDRQRGYRRLVRVVGGVFTVLAEDDFVFTLNQDYLVSVEAIGTSIRLYQDGAPVFDVADAAFKDGGVGLYCWANDNARFSDLRVDDLGQSSAIAYRFSFTTSNFADFFHHLHSFQDERWTREAEDGNLAPEIAKSVSPAMAVADAEIQAYASFATKVLGRDAQNSPKSFEVHRVTVGQNGVALLIRNPEPIDWKRTGLELSFASGPIGAPVVPGVAKLTDIATGGDSPNDEVVTVLARDRINLAGASIESHGIPGPLHDPFGAPLLDDTFDRPSGVLLEQEFDANALDRFRVVDAADALSGPSRWVVSDGAIRQTSNIQVAPLSDTAPERFGTVAVRGDRWSNIRMSTVLRSGDDDAIGVVFRYSDDRNWYRFSMDRERSYRRLVKSVEGTVTVLWEDHLGYDGLRAYEIRIDAYDDLILGYVDRELLFVVRDSKVKEGQVGFYSWGNRDARFERLLVESLEKSPLLLQAPLTDTAELTIVDSGAAGLPSNWAVTGGVARQTSIVGSDDAPLGIALPGTVALLEQSFTDCELAVVLTSKTGAIGVVFRYQDAVNWYRFSIDRARSYRRLVKCVAGVVTVLWQDTVAHGTGPHGFTVTAEGGRLRGSLDGTLLFDIMDDALGSGRVGLYCWRNPSARFGQVVVTDPVRRIGPWQILDQTVNGRPSSWRSSNGSLRQRTTIGNAAMPQTEGTVALAGPVEWADYSFEARLRSDSRGAIGIVFRHRGAGDWYRFSLDARRGYRRLVKCVGGSVSVLWQDSKSYAVGEPFSLKVDAIGSRLVGRHGDEFLFDLVDGNHSHGRVGLYCAENEGARFERATVTPLGLDAFAIFRDNFAVNDMSSWTILDEGAHNAPSRWLIANGVLQQLSDIYSDPTGANSIEKRGTQAIAGDVTWTDVIVSVQLRSHDDQAIGVLFRYQDALNYYRFSMDRQSSRRRLVRAVGGVFTTLWEDGTQYEIGRAYQLDLMAIGPKISVWIDNLPVLEVEDVALNHGSIGLYCWRNAGAEFLSVRVFTPDRFSPRGLLSEDFDWETPGRWTYHTAGSQSTPAVWTISGGELRQTSNVSGGSSATAELLKPGTTAIFNQPVGLGPAGLVPGSESWTDYRVTVRLRSDDNDGIGVLFRYRDENNWYRFSMDRERRYRRLVRCEGGIATELWHDAVRYVVEREYLVTLDVNGDSIVGYLDGVLLFSVRDAVHSNGTVGLYCWANPGARFSSVRVTAAEWSTHYRFTSDEKLLAAGTRVAVHSGNVAGWNQPPKPGIQHRFAALSHDPGRRRLPVDRPIHLRWRDRVGKLAHSRSFLPDSSYAPVTGISVLRKADGTDAAIFVPSMGSLRSTVSEGQYRLRLTYRRDNTMFDAESPVLSRAGDHSNELVTIDIPGVGD